MMSNITFVIFTYNEEKRLPFVLKNLSKYGRVCIFDGGSTDGTKTVAENYGAEFFIRPASTKPNVETEQNFQFIKSIIKTDWIYWGYTDNFVPKTLLEKFTEIAKENKFKQVVIPLYTYLWGNTKNYVHKGFAPFFFHKDFVDFKNNHMHGIGKFIGTPDQILTLPNREDLAIRHFSTYNEEKFVVGHMRYANQEALEKFQAGQKFGLWRLLRAMAAYAWMFGGQVFKNGCLGFLILLNYLAYRVMAYTRLYEMEKGITLETVEQSYSQKKQELLKEFDETTT